MDEQALGERPFVILGGAKFPIQPLTLGLLKRIGIGAAKQQQRVYFGTPGVATPAGAMLVDTVATEANFYEGTVQILAEALGKKVAEVEAIPNVVLSELTLAVKEIFRVTGLMRDDSTPSKAPTPSGEETGAPDGSDASTRE